MNLNLYDLSNNFKTKIILIPLLALINVYIDIFPNSGIQFESTKNKRAKQALFLYAFESNIIVYLFITKF